MSKSVALSKALVIALLFGVISFAGGMYVAKRLNEQQAASREIEDSLARAAINLQVAARIREGKSKEAIDLLDAMNTANIVALMHYKDVSDSDVVRRKRKVLGDFLKEWDTSQTDSRSVQTDPQTAQFIREIRDHLAQER